MLDRAKKTGNGALLNCYDTIESIEYSGCADVRLIRSFFKLNIAKMRLMKAVVKCKKTGAVLPFNDI